MNESNNVKVRKDVILYLLTFGCCRQMTMGYSGIGKILPIVQDLPFSIADFQLSIRALLELRGFSGTVKRHKVYYSRAITIKTWWIKALSYLR